ncbi:hypothetical protein BURK1_01153 [Burkholderiales bacterium]|nr:hypothetical protein BURK1_01153 [Burkholderiales bacterium]
MQAALDWEIVCRVVDNYGDAGVAFRLARQLAAEHGQRVTLWIDDPAPLARLAPGHDAARDASVVEGVAVRRGPDPGSPWTPPDVLVDAFGVGMPAPWVDAMARASRPPLWIVLEYLTAEAWADGAHLRSSPEPRTGLARRYWCPGFTPATGGLPRESGLLSQRDAFLRDPAARSAMLRSVRLGAPAGTRVALLFCYPTPALAGLFDAWSEDDSPTLALVPQGVAVDAVDRWTGGRVPHPGAPFVRGALTLASIPFVPQRAFDALLWSCDLAIVRGEDSFVRAQWASIPFAWHAYPQPDGAHRAKVAAFLDRYLAGAPPVPSAAVRAFTGALAGEDAGALGAAWPAFDLARDALAPHRRAWADGLASRADLASGLVELARKRV